VDPVGDGAEEQRVRTMGEKLGVEERKRRGWKWGFGSVKRRLKVLGECGKRRSNGEEAWELARTEFMALDLGKGNLSLLTRNALL